MNYQKCDMGRYRLHVLKTDLYKTITVKINFKKEIQKEEVTIRELLLDMLLLTSKQYPTRREFQLKKEELYNILINGNSVLSGRYSIFSLSVKFLNEMYTEKGMNEKSIRFLLDLLFEPNVKDDQFQEPLFTQQKNNYREYMEMFDEIPENYMMERFDEIRGKGTPREFHKLGYLEDLEKITPASLYDYYKRLLEEEIIDVFVIGNIDADEIKQIFNQHFLLRGENPKSLDHAIIDTNINEEKKVVEEKELEQSKLAINLKCEELSSYESKYVLGAYSYLLGGSPESMLFQEIREENSLCYFISANSSLVYHTITISAGIDGDAYEKTMEAIRQILDNMRHGDFEESLIEQYKTVFLSSLSSIEERPESCMSIYENHEYVGSDLREEKIKEIQKLTKEDLVSFANKIHIDTIYLLKGVK